MLSAPAGNTADMKTLIPVIDGHRCFSIFKVCIVAGRGEISQERATTAPGPVTSPMLTAGYPTLRVGPATLPASGADATSRATAP
jgi:hypothetical protein